MKIQHEYHFHNGFLAFAFFSYRMFSHYYQTSYKTCLFQQISLHRSKGEMVSSTVNTSITYIMNISNILHLCLLFGGLVIVYIPSLKSIDIHVADKIQYRVLF